MDASEIRANALANLIARGLDPNRIFTPEDLDGLRVAYEAARGGGEPLPSTEQMRRTIGNMEITHERIEIPRRADGAPSDDPSTNDTPTPAPLPSPPSFDELMKTHLHRKLEALEQRAWNTFAHFDVDSDGYVDRAELSRLVDAGASPEDVAKVLSDADGDGNGKIDYGEFLAWYTDHHDRAPSDSTQAPI